MTRVFGLALLLWFGAFPASAADAPADTRIRQIVADSQFRKAAVALEAGHERWVANTIAITEIPSPPFKEEARARAFADMLRQRRLSDVEIDAEGNVTALRNGTGSSPLLVLSAHLDTVFPEGTPVKVRREGDRLYAPGVGDDSAGLATILSLLDAMDTAGIRTKRDLLIVGTVGEEGAGDLRGVRYLFGKGKYRGRIGDFVSLDGTGIRTFGQAGTGSKRYRVTFRGPGGHSANDFGIVNPMMALGQTIVGLYDVKVTPNNATTYSASIIGGGTAVNAIPKEAWLEVDMRSASVAELDKLERQFLDIVHKAVETENAARSTAKGQITAEAKLTGSRPAGQTKSSSDLVRFVEAAYRAEGWNAAGRPGSTDSNIPMSLGIPAVTLPRVVNSDRGHSLEEWIGVEKEPNVKLKRVLLAAILATANR